MDRIKKYESPELWRLRYEPNQKLPEVRFNHDRVSGLRGVSTDGRRLILSIDMSCVESELVRESGETRPINIGDRLSFGEFTEEAKSDAPAVRFAISVLMEGLLNISKYAKRHVPINSQPPNHDCRWCGAVEPHEQHADHCPTRIARLALREYEKLLASNEKGPA